MAWPTVVGVVVIGATAGFLGGLFGKGGSAVAIVLPRSPDPAPGARTEPKQLAQRS